MDTELYTTISDQEAAESLKEASRQPGVGLSADDVAEAVAYAVGTPGTVAVSEIIIRPTNQAI